MFKGEPIAYWTILTGFIFYLFTQLFGIFLTDFIPYDINLLYQNHFLLAFFGFLGLVIMGAQLQFFRAITGLRKYEPSILRPIYLGSLIVGLSGMVIGGMLLEGIIIKISLIIYTVGVLIHLYWTLNQTRAKYFKFPLHYLLGSNLFFVVALGYVYKYIFENSFSLAANNFVIIHILSIGWISLNLQGAMLRILPMFIGKFVDRKFRLYADYHFWLSFIASLVFVGGFIMDLQLILIVGGSLWFLSWILTLITLYRSIFDFKRPIDYKVTLVFFITGMFWLIFGTVIVVPWLFESSLGINLRPLHIHMVLFAGLSMIILGAIHRINSFQLFTILYSGKRKDDIGLDDFLKVEFVLPLAIGFVLFPMMLIIGFWNNNYHMVGMAGFMNFVLSILFGIYLLSNMIHYLQEKNNAIPFWLKASEFEEEENND